MDSAGNATFSGKIKGAIVEASTFNGGTFNGNEFNGGSGWFHRGFAVKGNGGEGGEADFAIDSKMCIRDRYIPHPENLGRLVGIYQQEWL